MEIKKIMLFGSYDDEEFAEAISAEVNRAQWNGGKVDIQYSCAVSGGKVYYSALLIVREDKSNEKLS